MSQEGFKRIIECVEFLKQTLNVVLKFKPITVLDLLNKNLLVLNLYNRLTYLCSYIK